VIHDHFDGQGIVSIHEQCIGLVLREVAYVCSFETLYVLHEVSILCDRSVVYNMSLDTFKLSPNDHMRAQGAIPCVCVLRSTAPTEECQN
jgi:hypothetical protein